MSIQHPASSIQHPASSIQHPASSIQHPAIDGPYFVPNNQKFLNLLCPTTLNFVECFLEPTSERSRTSVDLPPSPIDPPSEGYITLRDSLQNDPVAFVSQQASQNRTIFDTLTPEEKQALLFETVLAIVDRCNAGQLLTSLPENYLKVLRTPWVADTLLTMHQKDPHLAAFEASLNGVNPASLPKFTGDINFVDFLKDKVSSGAVQRQLENFLISTDNSSEEERLVKFLDAFQTTKEQLSAAMRTASERAPLSVATVVFAMEQLRFDVSDGDSLRPILNQPNMDGFLNSYPALLKWTTTVGVSREWLEELTEKLERKPMELMVRIFGPQRWDPQSVKVLAPEEGQDVNEHMTVNERMQYVKLQPNVHLSGTLNNCFICLTGEGLYDLTRLTIDGSVICAGDDKTFNQVLLPDKTRRVSLMGFDFDARYLVHKFGTDEHFALSFHESEITHDDLGPDYPPIGDFDRTILETHRWSFNAYQRETYGLDETSNVGRERWGVANPNNLSKSNGLNARGIYEMLNSLLSLTPEEGKEGFVRLRFTAGPPLHNHILIVSRIKEEESESSAKDPKLLVLFDDEEHYRGIHDQEVGIISSRGYTNILKKTNVAARSYIQIRHRILEHLEGILEFPFDVSWPEGINSINDLQYNRGNIRFTPPVRSSELEISKGEDGKICVKKTGNPTTSSLHGS